ncbi:MAG: hypothetical protein M0Z38_13095, partial [Deltaproteobacteria bacterium]|nr:hypothetical protein [Deltaproteobacteria bacterium]
REGGKEPGEDLRTEPGHAPGVETGGIRMNKIDKDTLYRKIVECGEVIGLAVPRASEINLFPQ